MQNLNLLEFVAKAFPCHVHHFQYLAVLPGPPSIDSGAHGIEKLLPKIQVSEDFA